MGHMKNKTSKTLLSAVVMIVLALSMIGGATYALFTSTSTANLAVTSGTVNVVATPKNMTLHSPTLINTDGTIADDTNLATNDKFACGGTAKLENNTLTLSNIAAGDRVSFSIDFSNKSNIKTKYRIVVKSSGDMVLVSGLELSIQKNNEESKHYDRLAQYITEWRELKDPGAIETLHVVAELPADRGNEYSGRKCAFHFSIEAVQSNAKVSDYAVTADGKGTAYAEYLPLVYTGQELREKVMAVPAGESATFTLGENIKTKSLSDIITTNGTRAGTLNIAKKNITIDLNRHKLTMDNNNGACAQINNNGSLTLKNGTLEATRIEKYQPLFLVGRAKDYDVVNDVDTLTLENLTVNYTTDTSKVKDAWPALISSNANNKGQSNVTVRGTKFNVTNPLINAFYLPNQGTREFIDSSVTGPVSTSFLIVGGNWHIKGGSYVGSKFQYGSNCEIVQDKFIQNNDFDVWEGPYTVSNGTSSATYPTGILGKSSGNAYSTGDAILIGTRNSKEYYLGDVIIEDVSFVLEKANWADGTSGPSGYAVRFYDEMPLAKHGRIYIKVKDATAGGEALTDIVSVFRNKPDGGLEEERITHNTNEVIEYTGRENDGTIDGKSWREVESRRKYYNKETA